MTWKGEGRRRTIQDIPVGGVFVRNKRTYFRVVRHEGTSIHLEEFQLRNHVKLRDLTIVRDIEGLDSVHYL